MEGNKILVTGATGFIGGHVVRYLAGQGMQVSCLVRDTGKTDFIRDLPVRYFKGDILDHESLAEAIRGQDAIVHTAGKASDWGNYDSFYQANVLGTLNVLRAALDCSVSRVVITGSVSSYGEEDFQGLKDENSPYRSHYPYFPGRIFPSGMNYYRDSKAEMTQKAVEFASEHRMNLIVIEPVWVYGENEFGTGFYEYLKTVKSGLRFMPGSRKNNYHVIYAGELARAYYLALSGELPGVHRIIIGEKNPVNMADLYREFCLKAGLRPPVPVQKWITYPAGFALELISTLARSKNPPLLTRARVNMFYDSIGYSVTKAKLLLGFENEVPLEAGIGRTVAWYREHKLL